MSYVFVENFLHKFSNMKIKFFIAEIVKNNIFQETFEKKSMFEDFYSFSKLQLVEL